MNPRMLDSHYECPRWSIPGYGHGPGNGPDWGTAMIIGKSNNIYITGLSVENGGTQDYTTMKYNLLGDTVWRKSYNGLGNGNDIANAIALDDSENVYVTGASPGIGTDLDYVTIKYSQIVSEIQTVSQKILPGSGRLQNYPNPFSRQTKFKFQIKNTSLVRLSIYDVLGRTVAVLINQRLKPGHHKIIWDARNCPQGIYYYKLESGDYVATNKTAIIK